MQPWCSNGGQRAQWTISVIRRLGRSPDVRRQEIDRRVSVQALVDESFLAFPVALLEGAIECGYGTTLKAVEGGIVGGAQ